MKKIKHIATLALLVPVALLSSCSKEYLDRTPTTALDTELVLNDVDMIPSTVVGTMRMMYSSSFSGKYATVIGDIMTDMVSSIRGSNGSFKEMEEWNINQSTPDVETLWGAGYQIATASARTIEAAKRKLAGDTTALTSSQKNNLRSAIAASLVIKVYAEYFLAQYFCVDINVDKHDYAFSNNFRMPGSNPVKVGLILLKDRALGNEEAANMSTLESTYEFMEKEIAEAIEYFQASGSSKFTLAPEERFYPTLCAAYLVQARVFLAQHKYQQADEAAENALRNLPGSANETLISNPEALLNAYGETLSTEDIWSINYTNQDNLSANSLQNLFGSYGFSPSDKAVGLIKSGDIRKALYFTPKQKLPEGVTSYCLKYPNDNSVFNVPVFRVPEIYLIQAEARAAGKFGNANEALLKVIGARDSIVGKHADPEQQMISRYGLTDATMMQVILDENAREFLCEGHRWYDLRRNGVRLSREGSRDDNEKFPTHFEDYPLSTFAFPVPYGETSTEQWKKGRGTYADGRQDSKNWQNNAWDDKQGDSYSATVTLPVEGGDYERNEN